MTQCTSDEKDFGVFLIHRLAERWNKPVPEIYSILNDTDILDGYVIKCYDALHTLGAEYLVEDLTEFTREKGIAV
ncbi:MAG: DUF3791 domain-containing protein [Dehalococcoidia bacterium]|nr:DUF3791 domain-containing protein [Dehalococcoidia bacterium]